MCILQGTKQYILRNLDRLKSIDEEYPMVVARDYGFGYFFDCPSCYCKIQIPAEPLTCSQCRTRYLIVK